MQANATLFRHGDGFCMPVFASCDVTLRTYLGHITLYNMIETRLRLEIVDETHLVEDIR